MKTLKKATRRSALWFAFAGAAGVAFGSPQISIDSSTFDLGTIYEGKLPSATHAFKVKNTGDSTLHILNVKPG
jgi:hypothetical protein